MKPEILDYIRYRLTTAQETLLEARTLYEKTLLRGAVNRLYYACFYAVEALLWAEGRSSSKHSGVRSLFAVHWIKPRRLPAKMGAFYHHLFDCRQDSDYSRVAFTPEDVALLLEEAQAFVHTIADKVEELLPETE